MFFKVRQLIDFLPENNLDLVRPELTSDDLNRVDSNLDNIIPEDDVTPIDMKYVINSVADNNVFLNFVKTMPKILLHVMQSSMVSQLVSLQITAC